jgi:mono/diheme cytochrome c family protein
MNKLRLYFALSSVLFLIVLAISPLKDFFSEWKHYQHEYNDLLRQLPQRIKPVDIGIKQIWAQKLGRVDRCVTCHLGLTEKSLADAPEPFRTHPKIHHDVENFACTTCHEGQGSATTEEEAHGNVEYWERPILPAEYMEASCGKCHKEKEVPEAPILTLGRKLIEESNCVGCHKFGGYEKKWVPSLDGIGSKVNRTWLVHWLKHPKAYFSKARMPNFQFTDDEVNNLADFLMTFKSLPNNSRLDSLPKALARGSEAEQAEQVRVGEIRFREARCISCHPINGRGGSAATDLGKVASKVTGPWLYNYIQNPKRVQPGVEMPRFRFGPNELTEVVAYMRGEFVDYDMASLPPHTPDPAFYEKGLALFKKYNCAGCHTLAGMKKAEVMGPDLTFIGSKKLYEIDFGTSSIAHTLPSYLAAKIRDPRLFSPNMKMPNYEFTDEESKAITVALLGSTSDPIPDELKVLPKAPSTYAPQGIFGELVDDLACFGCHKMFGRGGQIAPDLSLEASQATRKWIEGYFKIPYSLRPILTERMPNFSLPDKEIKEIVDYIETVFIADSLAHNVDMNPENVSEGKVLYYGKFGCQSCHQINLKGGYVGPPLDHVGSRLQPGWVFHWLKNPQAFKPETIEPNNLLTDKEAEELTAYLMTLK